MSKISKGGSILNNAEQLPADDVAYNGELFYKDGDDAGLRIFSLIDDTDTNVPGSQTELAWKPVSTAATSSNFLPRPGGTMQGDIDMGGNRVINIATPEENTDLANQQYLNDSDFKTFNSLAGFSHNERTVPVYTAFPFGQVAQNSIVCWGVDNTNRQVIFYTSSDAAQYRSVYMGWRHTDEEQFVIVNTPVTVPGVANGEYVQYITNWGPGYASAAISRISDNEVLRVVVFDTQGSTVDTSQWVAFRTFTMAELGSTRHNFALVKRGGTTLLLHTEITSPSSIRLRVETATTTLRTLVILNRDEFDPIDRTGAGRNSPSLDFLNANYASPPFTSGFVYSPTSEKFISGFGSFWGYRTASGEALLAQAGIIMSWHIPMTWLFDGVGTPTNLIPLKTGSYRYSALSDSTWNTGTGGICSTLVDAGFISSFSTDDANNLFISSHYTFGSYAADMARVPSGLTMSVAPSLNSSMWTAPSGASKIMTIVLPAASPWTSMIRQNGPLTLGENLIIQGGSPAYWLLSGAKSLTVDYNKTMFSTTWATNDTLQLNTTAYGGFFDSIPTELMNDLTITGFGPQGQYLWEASGDFTTVVVSDTVGSESIIEAFVAPGKPVWTVEANGLTPVFTKTSLVVPEIPASIGRYFNPGYTDQVGAMTWNGSTASPVFYAMVVPPGVTNSISVARWATGSWAIVANGILQSQIISSQTSLGTNQIWVENRRNHHTFHGPSNTWYLSARVAILGDTPQWPYRVNVASGVASVQAGVGAFNPPVTTAGGPHAPRSFSSLGTSSFGFSKQFGMYFAASTSDQAACGILSTRDPRGVNATLTNDIWWTNNSLRNVSWVTTTPSVGLVAYLTDYQLFLGGYMAKIPTMSLVLQPSATQYIIVEKVTSLTDRSAIMVSVYNERPADSFSRICIAEIVTDINGIVTTELFPVNDITGTRLSTPLTISSSAIGVAVDHIRHQNTLGHTRWALAMTEGDSFGGSLGWNYYNPTTGLWQARVFTVHQGGIAVDGFINATGAITNSSDDALKTDKTVITQALDKVDQLNGYTYTRTDTGRKETGVIAQEVEEVLPEAVCTLPEIDKKSVVYGNMTALLIEAQRELVDLLADTKRDLGL